MKTTNQVIKAIQMNEQVTDTELKCGIIALNCWKASLYFDLARALTEAKEGKPLTPKTLRGLERAWETLHTNLNRDLGMFIMGSSFEPGITKEQQDERRTDSMLSSFNNLQKLLSQIGQND